MTSLCLGRFSDLVARIESDEPDLIDWDLIETVCKLTCDPVGRLVGDNVSDEVEDRSNEMMCLLL